MKLGFSQGTFTARIILGSSETPRKKTYFENTPNMQTKLKNPISSSISKFFARKEKALIKKINFIIQVKLPS